MNEETPSRWKSGTAIEYLKVTAEKLGLIWDF
jgi:hypothetical protein